MADGGNRQGKTDVQLALIQVILKDQEDFLKGADSKNAHNINTFKVVSLDVTNIL